MPVKRKPQSGRQRTRQKGATASDREIDRQYATVKRLVKHGHFSDELTEAVDQLQAAIARTGDTLKTKNRAFFYHCWALISECYYHCDRQEDARKAVGEGKELLQELTDLATSSSGSDAPLEDAELVQQQIRYAMNYLMAQYYRQHEYVVMRAELEKLLDLVKRKLPHADGLLAQACQYLAKVFRQLGLLDEAQSLFLEAAEHHYDRVKRKEREYRKQPKRLQEERAFAERWTGIIVGTGLGWIAHSAGRLNTALTNIMPARVLLLDKQDVMNQTYLDVLYASTKRCLYAGNREELSKVLEIVERAYAKFKAVNHKYFAMMAACEWSLAAMYMGEKDDLNVAREKIIEVEELAKDEGDGGRRDRRWEANALVIRSRIERRLGNYPAASQFASRAIEVADAQDAIQIAGYLERGKSHVVWAISKIAEAKTFSATTGHGGHDQEGFKLLRNARADLQQALQLNSISHSQSFGTPEYTNPKIEAMCHLYLARSFTHEHIWENAARHFSKWETLRTDIDHAGVHRLAAEVANELKNAREDFVIQRDPGTLKYDEYEKSLRRFLIEQSRNRTPRKEDQAELLGVTRPTLHNWEKELDMK